MHCLFLLTKCVGDLCWADGRFVDCDFGHTHLLLRLIKSKTLMTAFLEGCLILALTESFTLD